ncbi:MAG: hypothetical protein OJJ21_24250 [Ferrovibrio sp.]|uniref:hypothetical protein n=1 Tax=Ferrovibrio sp. TaxID=1917215 RepID=UPI002632A19C|nr:hypothetical protein [Ferrovibrio sp.]MCW0236729.1 hypothetical protein [Ferrovibrio sp.]
MTAAAQRLTAPDAAANLIVVFPTLALYPEAMAACITAFRGSKLIVVHPDSAPNPTLPPFLTQSLGRHSDQCTATTIVSPMFGNRRGMVLPVEVAVRIVFGAALVPRQDHVLITGCYRGWQPGSIDLLAEALSDIRFDVSVDDGVMRR